MRRVGVVLLPCCYIGAVLVVLAAPFSEPGAGEHGEDALAELRDCRPAQAQLVVGPACRQAPADFAEVGLPPEEPGYPLVLAAFDGVHI